MSMQYYSFSRLNKHATCPFSFYQKYVLKKKEPTTESTLLGKAVHKAIELIFKTGNQFDLSQYADLGLEYANTVVKKEGLDFNLDAKEVMFMLRNMPFTNIPNGVSFEQEKEIEVLLDPNDPFAPKVKAVIDFYTTDGTDTIITDWKTGRTKSEIMQLKVYAYLLHKMGLKVTHSKSYYLRDKHEDLVQVTEEVLKEAETWLTSQIQTIEQKLENVLMGDNLLTQFPASANSFCKYCSFKKDCPLNSLPVVDETIEIIEDNGQVGIKVGDMAKVIGIFNDSTGVPVIKVQVADGENNVEGDFYQHQVKLLTNKVEIPNEIKTLDQAKEIGAEIMRLEGVISDLKSLLKDYVDKNGNVEVGNKIFCFSDSTGYKFEPDGVKNLIKDLVCDGINPYVYVSVGKSEANKLFKDKDAKQKGWDEKRLLDGGYATLTSSKTFKAVALK